MTPPTARTWLTRAQAADYLSCHINHIDRLRAAGLPTVWLGRSIRISRDALDAWMVARQRGGEDGDEARDRAAVPAEQRRPVDRKGQRRPRRAPATTPRHPVWTVDVSESEVTG